MTANNTMRSLLAACAIAVLAACGGDDKVSANGTPTAPPAPPASPSPPPPSKCGPHPLVKAPPLPPPTGPVVDVADVNALVSAVASAAEGTTIRIEDGTYRLPNFLRFHNQKKNVTLRSKSGDRDKVILDGSVSSGKDILWFEDVENITIAHLTVQNSTQYCMVMKGEADANGVHVYDVRFRNCWTRGFKGTAPVDVLNQNQAKRPRNSSIRWSWFENDHKKQLDDAFNGDYIGGIDVMWLDNWVIEDNVFRMIQGRNNQARAAIFVWNHSQDVTVQRNVISGSDRGIAFGNPSGAAKHMTRGTIQNNMITRGSNKAIELVRTQQCRIIGNTVYSESLTWDRAVHSFQGSTGNHFEDNLVRGWGIRIDDSDATQANNTVGALAGHFVDPGNGDLHLTSLGAMSLPRGTQLAGKLDFDRELRPAAPLVGADECTP